MQCCLHCGSVSSPSFPGVCSSHLYVLLLQMYVGGAAMTQFYERLLSMIGVDLESDHLPEITVARNLKVKR